MSGSNTSKLLFLYDHPKPEWWMDGLSAALDILGEEFEIERWNMAEKDQHPGHFDFILGWGAFGSRVDRYLQEIRSLEQRAFDGNHQLMGLCVAGNATLPKGMNDYDVLFYETKWYRTFISHHPRIVHAFGVNTDLFSPPTIPMPVVWDYIGVGAFASWKRWERFIEKPGNKLVIGQYQVDNEAESLEIVRRLVKGGVMVSDHKNPFDLANHLFMSRTLYMPSDIYGGGERAVWEAKASGLKVEVEDDNLKLKELVDTDVKDHHWYAQQLKKGILSCLSS